MGQRFSWSGASPKGGEEGGPEEDFSEAWNQRDEGVLWEVAAWVPGLLLWRRIEDAERSLRRAIRHVQARPAAAEDLPALRATLLPALRLLPQLPAPEQLQVGFWVSSLLGVVLLKAAQGGPLPAHCAGFSAECVRWAAVAWSPASPLVNQTIDNNRHVLAVCAILAEVADEETRRNLVGIVTSCTVAPAAQFWTARFFQSVLQGVLAAVALEATGSMELQIAFPLVQGSHVAPSAELVENVLLFAEEWERRLARPRTDSPAWLAAASGLAGARQGAPLTPAACLAALFLARAGGGRAGGGELAARAGLARWLRSGVCDPPRCEQEHDVVLRGYVAAAAGRVLVRGQPLRVWEDLARALVLAVTTAVVPGSLPGRPPELLARHWRSAAGLMPLVAEPLAACLSSVPEDAQVPLILRPLELLCAEWCEGFDRLRGYPDPALRRLGVLVLMLVGGVARQADLARLSTQALVCCMRAMASVDAFRDAQTWGTALLSQEYEAVCKRVCEIGTSRGPAFVAALMWTLAEAHAHLVAARLRMGGAAHACRLYFLLGQAAAPELMDTERYFEWVWPVVLDCVRAGGERGDDRSPLAARAHSVAAVCFAHAGARGRSGEVAEYLSVGILACVAAPQQDVCRAMVHAMESLAKDTALRCEEGGEGAAEARELRRRVLSELGRAARHQATGDEAAEGLFRALCGAACHVDDAALPTLLYTDCHLQELLSARPPLRAVWVDWLVSRFSEGARETLVLRLLADFPDSAAAAAAPPERSALGALLRLPPWAGRTPRSAL